MNIYRLDLRRMALGGMLLLGPAAWAADVAPGANDVRPGKTRAAPVKPKTEGKGRTTSTSGVPVVHLEFRDRLVTVRSGAPQRTYDLQTKEGKVLAQNLTDAQFKKIDARLHELVQTALAGAKPGSNVIDARIEMREPRQMPSGGPR